ncbi:hypothetical protein J7E50_19140 [Pedobacter sp. ISL-68]|uniref:hypothetical protein n=1 Tax=unclassified Pedobacter TaxID=2628915 RepID=UPI001BE970D3|nr:MULTISPECIES: hypothetical protein [unclassified Pedobacter]MBT2560041.1 hypothetical protein [Pedobacter sp. ISL-64]MBT2592345.1 hypothetical protein [Pedobacter sp. ISL-68]
MRKLIFCMVLLFVGSLHAQTIKFTVEGVVQNPKNAKFAYLVSNATVAGKKDLFLVRPMDGNHFQLSATSDLEGKLLRAGFVFIDERGAITLAEVKAKIKQKVWYVGGSANLKTIFLEDVKLDIENPYNLEPAKIISGGIYLQQTKDVLAAFRDKKKLNFIKQNADSPIALMELSKLIPLYYSPFRSSGMGLDFGSPEELYSALSSRLKQSNEGKAIKKKIDEALKK